MMDDIVELLKENEAIPTSRDYVRLKELLDAGVDVVVKIQILPRGCEKDSYIANSGMDGERKFYDVGYGLVYDDDTFFKQCNRLDLEYIEPDNEVEDYTKPRIKIEVPTVGKKNGHINLVIKNLTYQQANVIKKMVHTWD